METENETPQSITREEFEAGVKFKNDGATYNYEYLDMNDVTSQIICDVYDNYYCGIETINNLSFQISIYIFGHYVELEVLFENCFKITE